MSGLLNKKTISLQKQINDINAEVGELATGQTATAVAIHSVGVVNPLAVGATVTELGDGAVHKTIITLDEVAMPVVDGTTPATDGAWGKMLLYTFPVGHIKVLGGHQVFPVGGLVASSAGSGLTSTSDFEIGVGTVAASNQSSFDLNNGTEENIVPHATVALTASKTTAVLSAVGSTDATYDGSTTAVIANLNMRTAADTDSGTAASTLTCSGTITIVWTNLGDN
jgi:hypothetical protein